MFRHIRTRILVLCLPIAFLAILISFILNVESGRKIINEQISQQIEARQFEQIAVIQSKVQSVKSFSATLSSVVSETYEDTDLSSYNHILESEIQKDTFILGAGIWFEPYIIDSSKKYVGPYVYRNGNSIEETDKYSDATYDYFSQAYYINAREVG